MSTRVANIRAWAAGLADLPPRPAHPDDASLLGIMAGALYSLEKADQLGYRDERGQAPDLPFFESEFRTALKKIGKAEQPPQLWLAGFWFISALVRLAPLVERLGLSLDEPSRRHLKHDVNWFKHRDEQHPVEPMETSWDEALRVAGDVSGELERRPKTT